MQCSEVTTVCKQVGDDKIAQICCNRLLMTHSTNFIRLTFVFVSHKIFLTRLFCAPRLQLSLSLCPLVKPLLLYTVWVINSFLLQNKKKHKKVSPDTNIRRIEGCYLPLFLVVLVRASWLSASTPDTRTCTSRLRSDLIIRSDLYGIWCPLKSYTTQTANQ